MSPLHRYWIKRSKTIYISPGLLKADSLDNAVQSRVLIGLVAMVYEVLFNSTIMSFHQIRSREHAKYKTVIHCSVPV